MTKIIPLRSGHLLREGQRVWWEYHGTGGREVVVLLNGLAMHTRAWYSSLDWLEGYDVLLYDYLGQGRSSCPDRPYSIPGFCDDLAAILDELELARVHVVGISYGGFVALDFARLHGDRLATLALSGILLSHERQFDMYQELSLRFYRSGETGFELYTHYLYEKIFGESFLRAVGPQRLEEMRQRFFERYSSQVHCLVRLTEAQDRLLRRLEEHLPGYRAIEAPTLIVTAGQDRAVPPWQQEKLLAVLPRARLLRIEGAGHVVHLERPERFFSLLRGLMQARSVDFEAGEE